MASPESKFPVDRSMVDQICHEFRHDMLQETFNSDNSSYVRINHRFLEQIRHPFYSTWCLDQRKHVVYLEFENKVDIEVASLIVNFTAQLADLMNAVVIVRYNSEFSLLIYKCLQNLVFSNHSLFDLIRLSVWGDTSCSRKKKFFYERERRSVLSVLENIGKNQYHAMLNSEADIEKLVGQICEIVDDYEGSRNRLICISQRDVFRSFRHWLLSSRLYFESASPANGDNKQLKLVNSIYEERSVVFDRGSRKESVDRALRNILRDKPLVEFVRSHNVRIVQYLMRDIFSMTSDAMLESFEQPRSAIYAIDPEATLKFGRILPIVKENSSSGASTASEEIQPFKQDKELTPKRTEKFGTGLRIRKELEYLDISEKDIEMKSFTSRDSFAFGTVSSGINSADIDPEILAELPDALSEALHSGNTQIVALMLKSICTCEVNTNLVEFFNFKFLKKQYEESYKRDENYFRKLMTKLGLKQNVCAQINAKFLDKVLDKLMCKNMNPSKIHQTLDEDTKTSRTFFQLYIFIWGILTQNLDIAEHALRWYPCSNEQIVAALAATRILDGIIKLLKNDHEISTESIQELNEKKIYFENLSLLLLKEDECTIQEEESENLESARLMREVSRTLPIDMVTSIKLHSRPSERKPTYTYTHSYNKKLEAESNFWKISTLMMAHEGECKLFIASEEVQGFVHEKNQEFNVKRKQTIDLILFNLLFYIFHCFLSLKLVPDKDNTSQAGSITYTVLLSVYGAIVMVFLADTITRNLQRIIINIKNIAPLKLLNLFKFSDGYIKAVFFLLFFIGYPLRITEIARPADFPVTLSGIFFSINALLLFIEVLKKALNLNRKLSLTIHLFISSIRKNAHFVFLAFIFMFGFGIAQYILKCSQTSCKLHENRGIWDYIPWIFLDPFKIMFGYYDIEMDAILEATPLRNLTTSNNTASRYSGEWMFTSTAFVLLILLIIWQFISQIIIINLLIANFIRIYEEISKEADLLWKKELLKTYFCYKDWSFIPFFYLLHKPNKPTEEKGTVGDEVSSRKEIYRPRSGRYWRRRGEEERRLIEISRQEDRIENVVLALISSNNQARRHLGRIEGYLEKIHQVPLPDRRVDEDELEDMLGSFVI